MKLKTLIIDDEESARSRLRKLLAPHPEIEVLGEAKDGLEAVELIERLRPELVFLDVQMPGLTGFEALQALPKSRPLPLVIFATAYDQYALAAFEANAISYLLKPINRNRLEQAIVRACQLNESKSQSEGERQRVHQVVKSAAQPLQQIVARQRNRFLLLRLDQIFFFEVENGIVKVKTENETYRTDYQINDLEARLPTPAFFRAHRSVIVNLRRVKDIAPFLKSTYLLRLNDHGASEIQVSERQAKKLRQMLMS